MKDDRKPQKNRKSSRKVEEHEPGVRQTQTTNDFERGVTDMTMFKQLSFPLVKKPTPPL